MKIAQIPAQLWHLVKKAWAWYRNLYRGPWWKKLLTILATFVLFIVLYCVAVMTNFLWLFGKSPSLSDIMHPKTVAASEIYSADGKLMGRFFNENRQPVPYDSISPIFIKALVSTEDERFYQHHGIDVQGIFAALKDATQGRARGASTISQQLVKNMFRVRTKYSNGLLGKIPGVKMLVMKSKEMILAVGIEMFYSKEEILTMYCNTVDFGSNAFGIKTAAKTYFDTTPSRLKAEESAVLVGLLKATSAYNPKINPKNSLSRRNVVLDNMRSHHVLSKAQCDSLKCLPIDLKFRVESAYDGEALYFRNAVANYIEEHVPELDPYTDGLRIYTTLDSRMQRYAEEAVDEQMQRVQQSFDSHWRGMGDVWRDERGNVIPGFIENIAKRTSHYKMLAARFESQPDSIDYYMNQPHPVKLFSYDGTQREEMMSTMDSIRYMVRFLHTGFVAMEPQTGYVRAWVSDVDFKTWKYDKVTAMRQPGSTFKLFVYAAALEQGMKPSDRVRDSYISIKTWDARKKEEVDWRPHNADGRFSNADVPLRSAFAQSINTVAVRLGQEVGIPTIVNTAHKMGIISPLDTIPSLPLGASDVNLLELVNSYATVANGGEYVEPVLVSKILDAEGRVVYEAKPKRRTALSPTTSFYLQKMLEAGVRDGGATSQALGAMMYMGSFDGKIDFGGKTGTSNNHSDAWFVGVTPALVGGAWVGGEYRSIHFRTGRLGQGSKTALPIFGLFMKKVLSDSSLSPTYMKRYEPAPDGIRPDDYSASYYAPRVDTAAVETDSLDVPDFGEADEAVEQLVPSKSPTEVEPVPDEEF